MRRITLDYCDYFVVGAASFFSGAVAAADVSGFVDDSVFKEDSELLLFSVVLLSLSALSAFAEAA